MAMSNDAVFGMPYRATYEFVPPINPLMDNEEDEAAIDAILEAEALALDKSVYVRFVADVEAVGDVTASCLMKGDAHGYGFQILLAQHENGQVFRQSVSDLSSNGVQSAPDTTIDLLALVHSLVGSNVHLNGRGYPINSLNDRPEGRGRTLFVYSKTEKGWLYTSSLLLDGIYTDTPLTRLLAVMEGIVDKVTLV